MNPAKFRRRLAAWAASVTLLTGLQSFAGTDMLLKVAGVDGESTVRGHEKEIIVTSFEHGHYVVTATGGGGTGTGKAIFNSLLIVKHTDKASPTLMLKCASGQHISDVTLSVRAQSANPYDFYTVKLTDVLVSSVDAAGNTQSADTRPLETIKLDFRRIEWTYVPQKPDGSLDVPVTHYWDLATQTGG